MGRARSLGELARTAAIAVAAACTLASGAPADQPRPAPPVPVPAPGAEFRGCPLSIGQLPVRAWVGRREDALSIRLTPVNRNFAHCLDLGALTLVGPDGEALPGRKSDDGWDWFTFAPNGAVPAKVDPVTSTRGFGVGLGLSIPLDGRAERAGSEFVYEFRGVPAGVENGEGWTWVGRARDRCAETEVLLRLPVDDLATCTTE